MASLLNALFQFAKNRRWVRLGLVAAAITLVGGPGLAEPPDRDAWWSPYGVVLEGDDGTPLRTFQQGGTTFVLGRLGERFTVRLTNHSDRRVEAVVSIDGRDAVSGRVADYVRERGYIVPPHGSVRVEGFRQSLARVAAFRFSRPSDSYSSRMGTPENVGVVGVAFFPERRVPPPIPRRETRWRIPRPSALPSHDDRAPREAPAAGSAPGRKSSAARDSLGDSRRAEGRRWESADAPSPSRLGTEYGESVESHVTEIPFVRENGVRPQTVVRVRYDDAEGLMARGIDVYESPYWPEDDPGYGTPEAFPANRFAPPPP